MRHSRVTDTTLSDIGTESLSWVLHPTGTPTPTQWWEITDNGSLMTRGETALCYGVRYATYMPTSNGATWNGRSAADNYSRFHPIVNPESITANLGVLFGSNGPRDRGIQNLSMCLPYAPNGSHLSPGKVQGLVIPNEICDSVGGSRSLNAWVRPRYYRVLCDGVDSSGILDGAVIGSTFSVYPVSDVSKTGWTGVSNNTTLALNIDDATVNDSDYVWSTNATARTFEVRLDTTTKAPMVFHDNVVTYRIARSDSGTIPGDANPGDALDVTVSLYHGTTLIASETRAVPANPTTYSFTLSEAEAVALDAFKNVWSSDDANSLAVTNMRLRFVTTASSGGSPRGCAIFAAKFSAPSDWYGFWNAARAKAETPDEVLFQTPKVWELAADVQSWGMKRNKTISLDVWFEVYKRVSASAFYLMIGSRDSVTYGGGVDVAHGLIGFQVKANKNFDPNSETYKLTFHGGTWRPIQADGDEFIFDEFTQQAGGGLDGVVNSKWCWNQDNSVQDGVLFYWKCEVPYIVLLDYDDSTDLHPTKSAVVYIPENVTGVITNTQRNGTGNKYMYIQNAGGVWNGRTATKFVPLYSSQHNATGTFTDETTTTEPEYIMVEKVPQTTTYAYTSSTTWTCPTGVTSVEVRCWGAGGGGGGADATDANAGGGGGGAFAKKQNLTVIPGSVYTITVGAGGTAGPAGGASNAGIGGDTEFSLSGTVYCRAKGGSGGESAVFDAEGNGGQGGQSASCIGDVVRSGGNGAIGDDTYGGGGGGSSASSSASGVSATGNAGATLTNAGSGGKGENVTASVAGSSPGGGGGGAGEGTVSAGKAGGGGKLTLTY